MSGITPDVGLANKVDQARVRNNVPDLAETDQLASGSNYLKLRQLPLSQVAIGAHSEHVAGVLSDQSYAEVIISVARKPEEFFTDRNDLRVPESLKKIACLAKTLAVGTAVNLRHQQITVKKGSTDARIELALGGKQLFDETTATVFAVIAEMISVQEGGKSGLLLNEGQANLFYLSGCVVVVCWHSANGAWCVNAWMRDCFLWLHGSRVFSLGN